jgi:hypothetical protein
LHAALRSGHADLDRDQVTADDVDRDRRINGEPLLYDIECCLLRDQERRPEPVRLLLVYPVELTAAELIEDWSRRRPSKPWLIS